MADVERSLLVIGQNEEIGAVTPAAARRARIEVRNRMLRMIREIEHSYQRAELAARRGA